MSSADLTSWPVPPVIVMQNLDTAGQAANFGDVFCNSFKAFGAAGLVTNGTGGGISSALSRSPSRVFYNGIVCAHGYMHLLETYGPVQVGGIDVYPNDLLHGDANGVTTIPLAIAAEAADVSAEYAAAEAVVIEAAQSGAASLQDLRDAYSEMSRRITQLMRARPKVLTPHNQEIVMRLYVTGGTGLVGSNVIRLARQPRH